MVKSPVTQVADVTVNSRSINDMGIMRDMGKESNKVPVRMSRKKEKRIIREGERSMVVFLVIRGLG